MDRKELNATIVILLEKATSNTELGRRKRAVKELQMVIALIDEFKKQEEEQNANQE